MKDFGLFQTANAKMKSVLETAQSISLTPAPVLISGEQGVGKNQLIQLILERSRFQKTMHRCGAFHRFPDNVKNGDAIVIEGLDEMNLLQQAEVSEKMDFLKAQNIQVRWFATSTVNPADQVKKNLLRRDLFYRLSVIHLQIPSLRERPEDILVLSQFFVQVFSLMKSKAPYHMTPEAQMRLNSYGWPGNVAELENVIERAVSLAQGTEITANEIQFAEMNSSMAPTMGTTLSEMERKLILQTLQLTQQNKTRAAQMLGISIRTLRNKLNEYRQEGVL